MNTNHLTIKKSLMHFGLHAKQAPVSLLVYVSAQGVRGARLVVSGCVQEGGSQPQEAANGKSATRHSRQHPQLRRHHHQALAGQYGSYCGGVHCVTPTWTRHVLPQCLPRHLHTAKAGFWTHQVRA